MPVEEVLNSGLLTRERKKEVSGYISEALSVGKK
jgi:hypothetical protein